MKKSYIHLPNLDLLWVETRLTLIIYLLKVPLWNDSSDLEKRLYLYFKLWKLLSSQFLFDIGYRGSCLSIFNTNTMWALLHTLFLRWEHTPLVFRIWASLPSEPGGVQLWLPLWLCCLGERQLTRLLVATMSVCKDQNSPKYLPEVIRGLFRPLQSSTIKSRNHYLLFVQFYPTPCPLLDRKILNGNHKPRKVTDQSCNPTVKGYLCVHFDF